MPNYDVAVVGAGLAGLSAAAVLAAAGRKVVLTDAADRPGGVLAPVDHEGFRFDAGPAAVYGLEQNGVLSVLCTAAGVDAGPAVLPVRYQVALPGRRITVSPVLEETLVELRREFPGEIDRISRFYRDAEHILRKSRSGRLAAYLSSRRSSKVFLRSYGFPKDLNALYEAAARHFFGTGLDKLPLSSFALMLSTPPSGFAGGYAMLAGQLAARVRDRGGAVLWSEAWPEIVMKGRKVTGIGTSQGVYTVRRVLVNADAGGPRGERTLFYGVRAEVMPVRMENTVLCLPDAGRPEDVYSVAISPEGKSAPAGMRTVAATFPETRNAPEPREKLRGLLCGLMPFFDDFVVSQAEADAAGRRVALPESVLDRRGAKNVLLLPDSSLSLVPSLRSALRAVDTLT